MSRRITRSRDLPSWFDTSKYANAIRLDARGWYEQIVVRQECFHMVWHATIEDDDLDDDSIYGIKPSALLSAVRSRPIFAFFGSEYQLSIQKALQVRSNEDSIGKDHPPGVSGITLIDVANLVSQLPSTRQAEFLNWLDDAMQRYSNSFEHIRHSTSDPEWLVESISGLGFHPIKIDSNLPDKILRESFDLYLQHNLQLPDWFLKGKPQRSNMFLEWCNCGLLQYMDLQTWSLETDTTITNKVLARGIFPDNLEKGEENIRTTTKKHAERILDEGIEVSTFMATLKAYAQLEDYIANQ